MARSDLSLAVASRQPIQKRRPKRRVHAQSHYQATQKLFATEAIAMIAVNGVLAIAATIAIVRLVSYNMSQQAKIQIINAEVAATEERVGNVREEFSQYFDPLQTKVMMREQSHRVEAGQARIIFTEPAPPAEHPTLSEDAPEQSLSVDTHDPLLTPQTNP